MRFQPGRLAISLVAAGSLVLVSCGDDDNLEPVLDTSVRDTSDSAGSTVPGTTVPGALPKPEVELPEALPTELVITDLIEGTGEPAKEGDTVTVHYVGVRSEDGTEFDNSYDRGQPYPVTLGEGGVIAGWDQGLIGVKQGGRRQLDIPAELAYGESGAGDLIKPGDALSFVIDVVSIEFAPPPPTLAPMADAADCPAADGSSPAQQEFTEYPSTCIDVTKGYTAEIETSLGSVTVELFPDKAPVAVNSFVVLARSHYFDGTACHRIIPQYIAQCGDPTGTGSGDPGYEFRDELPQAGEYEVGSLAMANHGPDTNGSQFFIFTGPDATAALPPDYTLFGKVIEGLDDTVPAIDAAGNPDNNGMPPLQDVTIESITIIEGEPRETEESSTASEESSTVESTPETTASA